LVAFQNKHANPRPVSSRRTPCVFALSVRPSLAPFVGALVRTPGIPTRSTAPTSATVRGVRYEVGGLNKRGRGADAVPLRVADVDAGTGEQAGVVVEAEPSGITSLLAQSAAAEDAADAAVHAAGHGTEHGTEAWGVGAPAPRCAPGPRAPRRAFRALIVGGTVLTPVDGSSPALGPFPRLPTSPRLMCASQCTRRRVPARSSRCSCSRPSHTSCARFLTRSSACPSRAEPGREHLVRLHVRTVGRERGARPRRVTILPRRAHQREHARDRARWCNLARGPRVSARMPGRVRRAQPASRRAGAWRAPHSANSPRT
jgi:hypothetical protein